MLLPSRDRGESGADELTVGVLFLDLSSLDVRMVLQKEGWFSEWNCDKVCEEVWIVFRGCSLLTRVLRLLKVSDIAWFMQQITKY